MYKTTITFVAGLISFMLVTSCDSTFEPIQQSDEIAFSIFGTLDFHADTQWVRVMPIGETLLPNDPDIRRAEVTLTRLKTGETVTLEDSIFALRNNTYVLNYWTDTSLHPEEDYLLQAEAADGRTSLANVSIPSPIPRPVIDYDTLREEGIVEIPIADSLIVVESRFVVREIRRFGLPGDIVEVNSSHIDYLFTTDQGHQRFQIKGKELIENELGHSAYEVLEREVIIATGSSEWPDLANLTEEEIPIPGNYSNVENGTGVVAGIASHTVPLKRCANEEDELISCEE